MNLGLFQHDVNVIWDLAPHDLAIMDHLIRDQPTAIVATGASHLNGHEDVAYITVYFQSSMIAHFNVNWLSPVKVRTTLIGGEKKMVVWNDVEADEKVKVYDKGVEITAREGVYDLLVSYRSGDMWAPKVEQVEALKAECQYFIECVKNGKDPFNDGVPGLKVVKMLEAARPRRSHAQRGHGLIYERLPPCIAPDVKLGKNVQLSKFINLYGCTIGDEHEDRRLRRDSEERRQSEQLQDLQPHLHLRRGHDRG